MGFVASPKPKALDLSYDQYLPVYKGIAKTVVTVADDGRRVVFPAGNIQRYLTIDTAL
ncbi:DUF2835 family protein [Methylomonas sp. MK1]|uniref:DUF2835 family protein n=1 Tax=Methylomonas sp. MK1 TaxID=1131552 RepID=UPI0003A04AAD|nr:DUF2835 family protein [Methylomonas sp. MK1]